MKKFKKVLPWIKLGTTVVATVVVVAIAVIANKAGYEEGYEDAVIDVILDGLGPVAQETLPGNG